MIAETTKSPDSADDAADLAAAFKSAMRRLASGVAIITTSYEGRRYGMTATALMSLSMDPPSLAVGINRSATMYRPLLERRAFCVNLLHESHGELCASFSAQPADERFRSGDWFDDEDRLPCLTDSEASISCKLGPALIFGSHTIFVGEAFRLLLNNRFTPLIYLNGAIGAVKIGS
jgi:flavin reductase (DIM6/NTAB) family NADH-FMN oxidoreductase RutF